MKWAYGINQKVKAALLLGIILVAVLLNNLWERNNIRNLEKSFSSICDDRLIPATYVFKLTDHLYKKRLLWPGLEEKRESAGKEMALHDRMMDSLLRDFESTYLVDAESKALYRFESQLQHCRKLEAQLAAGSSIQPALTQEFDHALHQLHLLSYIQVDIGKGLKKSSKGVLANSNMLYQLEISLLLIIALIIQVLVFASKTIKPGRPGKAELN